MNLLKLCLVRLTNIPRKLGKAFYLRFNHILFFFNGIYVGKKIKVYNRIYISKHHTATITVGSNFTFTSGESLILYAETLEELFMHQRTPLFR